MTISDRVDAASRSVVQLLVDKEPLNYLEAGALYGMVTMGRYHVAVLSVYHNHAQDLELKQLINEAIDNLTEKVIRKCEDLLRAGNAKVPTIEYPEHALVERLEIPAAARFTDAEIAMALTNMDAAGQLALLTGMRQSYQLEISSTLREQLNAALDWGYRLLQLMLHRGWLPATVKVEQR